MEYYCVRNTCSGRDHVIQADSLEQAWERAAVNALGPGWSFVEDLGPIANVWRAGEYTYERPICAPVLLWVCKLSFHRP